MHFFELHHDRYDVSCGVTETKSLISGSNRVINFES